MSRLQHEPFEKRRELVTALAVAGVPQCRIAAYISIIEKMPRWHYRNTLDLAKESMCARAAHNLFRITSTGSGMAAVLAAQYIGAHGGWRDISRTEHQVEPESSNGLPGLLQRVCAAAATAGNFSQNKPDARADSTGILRFNHESKAR